MKKKILAVILSLLVIFSNSSFVFATDYEEESGDVTIDTYEVSPYYSDSVISTQYGITVNSPSWDPRPYGLVTSVKNQGGLGWCWDYATQAAAESYLITHNMASNTIDLSEYYYASYIYDRDFASHYSWTDYLDMGYQAPSFINDNHYEYLALESNYPLKDGPQKTDVPNPVSDLSNYSYKINRAYIATDIEKIKEYIIKFGGGVLSTSSPNTIKCTNNDDRYCYSVSSNGHGMEIVGWNDNFVNPNGITEGCWLVKNSWGTSKFDVLTEYNSSGYIWIPYTEFNKTYDACTFFEIITKDKAESIKTSNVTLNVGESIDVRNYIPACEDIGSIGTDLKKVSDYIYIPQYPGNYEFHVFEKDQGNLIALIDVTVPSYTPIKKSFNLYYNEDIKTEIGKYLPANVDVYRYEGDTDSTNYGSRVINVYGGDCPDRKFKLGEFTVDILPKTELTVNADKTYEFANQISGNYPIEATLDNHNVIENCEVISSNPDVATITRGDKRFLYQLKGVGETKITVTHKDTGKSASFTVKVTQSTATLDLTIYKTEIKDNETTSIWYNSNRSNVTWESSTGTLIGYGGNGLATYVTLTPGTVTAKTDVVVTFSIPGTDIKKSVTVTVNPSVVTPTVDPTPVVPTIEPTVIPTTPIVTPSITPTTTTESSSKFDTMPPITPKTTIIKSEPNGKFTYKNATIKLDITKGSFTVYGGTSIPKTYTAYQGTSKETKLYATTIGKNAYKNSKIKTLTIPNTVTEIKDGAFAGSQIKNIIIPKSVKKIGKNAFKGCKNLKSITFKGKTTLVKKSGIAKAVKVIVPKRFKAIYQKALKGYKIK